MVLRYRFGVFSVIVVVALLGVFGHVFVFWVWFQVFSFFRKWGIEWKNMKEIKVFHMAEQIFLPEDLRNNVRILTWQAELD